MKKEPRPDPAPRYRDAVICRRYGISRTTLWRWRKKGKFKSFQVTEGGPNFTTPEELASLERALTDAE
jgi:predicted site-specific integrase-resolvase